MKRVADITACGSALEALVTSAQDELILVAPFLKAPVLQRLTQELSGTVRVTVVTRWRPDEVARGVSDPQAWDVIRGRPGSRFLLCQRLHAKYYRADARCLVGSANLTHRALGWCASPNLEVLVEQEFDTSGPFSQFEHQLIHDSVPASELLRTLVMQAAEGLKIAAPAEAPELGECTSGNALDVWFPRSRDPAAPWRLYSEGAASMPVTAAESAAFDLSTISPPAGLSLDEFVDFVRAFLLQLPLVSALDDFVATPRRFGAVVAFLDEQGLGTATRGDLANVWQTLMRWLLHFYPERYERTVPRHSEVFVRRSL